VVIGTASATNARTRYRSAPRSQLIRLPWARPPRDPEREQARDESPPLRHTTAFQGRPLRKGLDRHVVGRFCDAFAAISAADRTRMIEVVGVPAERVPLMPLGLIPRAERPYRRLLRTELGIPPDAPVVSTLCMLRPQKALDVLIRAFARWWPSTEKPDS
jgi:hypothetical protein